MNITIITASGRRATVSRESVLTHLKIILPGQHTIEVLEATFDKIVTTDKE